MNDILLTPIKLSELEILIENSVMKALKQSANAKDTVRPAEPELLNIKGAAQLLGLAVPTLYSMTSDRTLPHCKKGKRLYFDRKELLTWVKDGKRKTVSDLQNEASHWPSKNSNTNGKHKRVAA